MFHWKYNHPQGLWLCEWVKQKWITLGSTSLWQTMAMEKMKWVYVTKSSEHLQLGQGWQIAFVQISSSNSLVCFLLFITSQLFILHQFLFRWTSSSTWKCPQTRLASRRWSCLKSIINKIDHLSALIIIIIHRLSSLQPQVLDVTPSGQLSLAWDGPQVFQWCMFIKIFCVLVWMTIGLRVCLVQGQDIDHYIVEYYRDQWQLWLRYLDTRNLLPFTSSSLLIQ